MTVTGSGRDKLTKRQAQVLAVINQSIEHEGYPPTIREIGSCLDIKSTNAVNDHLKALERKGYLNRNESKSRALVPVDMNDDMVEVPLVGRIAAGQPILAVQNLEDKVKVDRFFLGSAQDVFALRVVGESMIGDGIDDGDFIFVR
jgi:repressor LexA